MSGPGRSAGVDLLRGTAVCLVLLRHAWPGQFQGAGLTGVVVFFALSGYLITGVLLDELRETGRLRLRRFYVRRAARLVPALLVVLAVVVAVTVLLDPLHDRDELARTVLVAVTWTGDLPVHHGGAATFHLWTLAVEEQFYLLWPVLLLAAHPRPGRALAVAGVVCLLGCAATTWWLRADPDLGYTLPTSWAPCFVLGAAARLHADRARAWVPAGWTVLAVSAVVAGSCVVPWRGHLATYLVGGPVIAGCTAVLLLASRAHPVLRPVTAGPRHLVGALVALGTISYAVYLWDYPLTLWLRAVPPLGDLAGPLAVALAVAAAVLSRRFVEEPVLRRVRRSTSRSAGRPAEVPA